MTKRRKPGRRVAGLGRDAMAVNLNVSMRHRGVMAAHALAHETILVAVHAAVVVHNILPEAAAGRAASARRSRKHWG